MSSENEAWWSKNQRYFYPRCAPSPRRTLPPWPPEPVNFPLDCPVRFILAEPKAKNFTLILLILVYAATAGIIGGVWLAAYLESPDPWKLIFNILKWWWLQ